MLQDVTQIINICALDGLYFEEVMGHELHPPIVDRRRHLLLPDRLGLLYDIAVVLYDKLEFGVQFCETETHPA